MGKFGEFGVGVNLPGNTFEKLAFPRSPLADALSVLGDTAQKLSDRRVNERTIDARATGRGRAGAKPKTSYTVDENGDVVEVGGGLEAGGLDDENDDIGGNCPDGRCGINGGYGAKRLPPGGAPTASSPIEIAGQAQPKNAGPVRLDPRFQQSAVGRPGPADAKVNPNHVVYGGGWPKRDDGTPMSVLEKARYDHERSLAATAQATAEVQPVRGLFSTPAQARAAHAANQQIRVKGTQAAADLTKFNYEAAVKQYELAVKEGDKAGEESAAEDMARALNALHQSMLPPGPKRMPGEKPRADKPTLHTSPYSAALGFKTLSEAYPRVVNDYRTHQRKIHDDGRAREESLRGAFSRAEALGVNLTADRADVMRYLKPEELDKTVAAWSEADKETKKRTTARKDNTIRAATLTKFFPEGGSRGAMLLEAVARTEDPAAQKELIDDFEQMMSKQTSKDVDVLAKSAIESASRADFGSARTDFSKAVEKYETAMSAFRDLGGVPAHERDFISDAKSGKPPRREAAPKGIEMDRAAEAILRAYRSHEKMREEAAKRGLTVPPPLELPDELKARLGTPSGTAGGASEFRLEIGAESE